MEVLRHIDRLSGLRRGLAWPIGKALAAARARRQPAFPLTAEAAASKSSCCSYGVRLGGGSSGRGSVQLAAAVIQSAPVVDGGAHSADEGRSRSRCSSCPVETIMTTPKKKRPDNYILTIYIEQVTCVFSFFISLSYCTYFNFSNHFSLLYLLS